MTSIRITIPVEPGAKTCEGCRWLWRFKLPGKTPDYEFRCNLFQSGCSRGVRLPECLASEREKVPWKECWEVRFVRNGSVVSRISPFQSIESARDYIKTSRKCRAQGTKIRLIHVTRYRRRANG